MPVALVDPLVPQLPVVPLVDPLVPYCDAEPPVPYDEDATGDDSFWPPGAVGAINRIFGFLILAIAVQLVWNGVADFRG